MISSEAWDSLVHELPRTCALPHIFSSHHNKCLQNFKTVVWINNKVVLYNTGNYIQYPVINHDGKEYKKSVCV